LVSKIKILWTFPGTWALKTNKTATDKKQKPKQARKGERLLTNKQIKLVAAYVFKDHEDNTLAAALAETIRAYAIPNEVEYFTPYMLEFSLRSLFAGKGELE
jgi:hypothetical protein